MGLIERPLADSERAALRRYVRGLGLDEDWAIGVMIESAVWNVEHLETQLAAAVEALRKYGHHKWTCAALASTQDRKAPCDCGWDDALTHARGH